MAVGRRDCWIEAEVCLLTCLSLHAADQGIVHRDIKHKNIFLSNQGKNPQVKIADFGLAIFLEDD